MRKDLLLQDNEAYSTWLLLAVSHCATSTRLHVSKHMEVTSQALQSLLRRCLTRVLSIV